MTDTELEIRDHWREYKIKHNLASESRTVKFIRIRLIKEMEGIE